MRKIAQVTAYGRAVYAPGSRNSTQTSELKVLAAIACLQCGQFIGDIVSRTKKYVDEVILCDDGSHDDTSEVAREAGAIVINHEVNRGYGESIRDCFEVAKARGADIVVTLDGDNQHYPEEIPALLTPIVNGEADLVIGSRFLGGKTNMPRYRKLGIKVITWLFNFGSKTKISDAQSGFKAYSRKFLDTLLITESRMGASVEVPLKARGNGFVIREVSISCLYHSSGSSLNPVHQGFGTAFTVVKLRLKRYIKEGILTRILL